MLIEYGTNMEITYKTIAELFNELSVIYSSLIFGDPISVDDIIEYQSKYKISFPSEVRKYLLKYNGISVNNGSFRIYGIHQKNDNLEIRTILALMQDFGWKENHWLPISTDCCGGYYVINVIDSQKGSNPIYFIDKEDYTMPAYIAASSLKHFIYFYTNDIVLEKKANKASGWPFDEYFVTKMDQDIDLYSNTVNLPWRI